MCNKAVYYYLHALEFVSECKDSKLCDKAVDTHPSTMRFAPECKDSQEMCYKGVNRCFCICFYTW